MHSRKRRSRGRTAPSSNSIWNRRKRPAAGPGRRRRGLSLERLEGRALLANTPPTGMDNTVTTIEDQSRPFVEGDFGFSDASDAPTPNAFLAVKITSLPTVGSLTNNGAPITAGDLVTVVDIAAGKLLFAPAANASGTAYASFTFQVQDDGGGGVDLDPSPNTITIDVTPVNDQPVRTAGTPAPVSVNEDAANATAVSLELGALDYGRGGGADESSQVLSYRVTVIPSFITIEKGSGALAGQPVTAGNPVTLDELRGLKFKTVANANGTGNLTWTVTDDGGTANGGTDTLTETLSVNVNAVNDAPNVIGNAVLAAVLEDATDPAGETVASLFADCFDDSIDQISGGSSANTLAGIVLTANAATAAQGKWQWFRATTSTWFDVLTVLSDSVGTYLTAATKLRFLPVTNFNGLPGNLTARLVDSSASGLVLGANVDVSTGKNGVSLATAALSTSVTAVNDAPTVINGGSATLAAVDQDTATPPGDTIANLFGGNFSDATDAVTGGSSAHSLLGVVLTANAATAAEGVWQWNNAGTWTAIATTPTLSSTNGLFLAATTSIRFRPAAGYNGTPGALTARLVDSSEVAPTNSDDFSTNGGITPFSAATVTLGTSVTAVPAQPSAPVLDAGSDTGQSNSDRITKEQYPKFTGVAGSAPANVTIEVFAGDTKLGSCKADGTGAWSFDMKPPAAGTTLTAPTFFTTKGIFAITARAVNDAGKAGAFSAPTVITIDLDAPAVPLAPTLDPNPAIDTGIPGDGKTSNPTPTLRVDAPADAVGVTIVLVNTAATPSTITLPATQVPGTNTWQATTSTLVVGNWTVTATATDVAGNVSLSSPPFALTILPAPVTPTKPDLQAASDSGVSNTDDVTNITLPTFNVIAPTGSTQVELFRNGTTIGLATKAADGTTWTLVILEPWADGTYLVTAKITNDAGEVSPMSPATTVVIDTTAPALQSFGAVTPTPRTTSVSSIDATFNEAVFGVTAAAFGLRYNDRISLTLQGTATTTPQPTVVTVGAAKGSTGWSLGSLDAVTKATGTYKLSLLNTAGTSGVTDQAGNLVATSTLARQWEMDVTAPTVASFTLAPAGSQPRKDPVSSITVTFSENVTGVDVNDFELLLGTTVQTLPNTVTLTPLAGPATTYTLAGLAGLTAATGTYTLRLKAAGSGIVDGLGNAFGADASTSWDTDATAPTGAFATVATPTGTALQSIGLNFSEPVTGVELGDFTLTRDGAPVALTGVSLTPATGPSAVYALTGLGALTGTSGVYVLTLSKSAGTAVKDVAGNTLAADITRTWTADSAVPTATIALPTAGTPRNTAVTRADVTFTLPVTGVDLSDFRLTKNGTVVTLTGTATVTGAGTTWTLNNLGTLTAGDGSYVLTLVAAGSGIVRTVAPANPLAADALASWTMDATPPTVDLSVVSRVTSLGSTRFTIQALFSEAVTGFAMGDVTVSAGGTKSATVTPVTGSGDRAYRFVVTVAPSPRDPVAVSIAANGAVDTAGNGNAASNPLNLVTDLIAPSVTLSGPALTNAAPFTVRATFNENVTGFATADVTVSNGTATAVTPVGASQSLYDITIAPAADGVVGVSVGATKAFDASGNGNSPSNSLSVRVDRTAPTVKLASLSGTISRYAVLQFSATFSEPVTGVDGNDLAVTNGSVSNVVGSGRSWTFFVKPTADGNVTASVNAAGAFDAATNGNVVSNTVTVLSDRTAPKAIVSAPKAGIATITFSEPVSGFNLADLKLTRNGAAVALAAGSLQNPSGDRTNWEIDVKTLTSTQATYVLRLVATGSGIVDDAGNPLLVDASATFTVDTTPPTAGFSGIPRVTKAAIDSATVAFSEPVTGLDVADLELRRNGTVVPLTDPPVTVSPATGPAATYRITGLADLVAKEGSYTLLLRAANAKITDGSGNALTRDAQVTWIVDLTAPEVATFGPVSQATNASPVTSVPITFTEPVAGVDISDFTLRRDGVVVALAGAKVAPVGTGGRDFLISGLSPLTGLAGGYSLTLRSVGTGIADIAGNALAADKDTTWVNVGVVKPGTVSAAFVAVSPNPRVDPVASVTVAFSAPVLNVDAGDFTLTRTVGGTTTTLSGFAVSGSGTTRAISGLGALTVDAGVYELRLRAAGSGIATSGGLGLAQDAVTTWTTLANTAVPPTVTITPGAAAIDGAIDAVTIQFSKPVTGVTLSALRLTRDGLTVGLPGTVLTGGGDTYELRGLSPLSCFIGEYALTLVAAGSGIRSIDGAALATDATTTWTVIETTLRAAFLAVDTPRTSPLPAVQLRFSTLVKGVDLADFELERDGTVVPLYGVTVTGSGAAWVVGNLAPVQGVSGVYTLRLKIKNGDIQTSGGLTLAQDAVVSWTIK